MSRGPNRCGALAARSRLLVLASLVAFAAACSSATTTTAGPVPSPPKPTGELAKPAATIISDAREQLLAAKSVHVSGAFATQITVSPPPKSRASSTPTTAEQQLDLRLGRMPNGTALASGAVKTTTSATASAAPVAVSLVRIGNVLYLKGDRSYYERIGRKAAAVAGRWLSLPIGDDRSLAALTDIREFAAGLADPASPKTLGETKLGDVRAIEIRSGSAIVYVAASGPPRLLRLQRASGTLNFAEYDAKFSVRAPAGAVPLASVRG